MTFDLDSQLRDWMISLIHCFYGISLSPDISHAQIISLLRKGEISKMVVNEK
jgi:predicted protein tyrosine phosphatase